MAIEYYLIESENPEAALKQINKEIIILRDENQEKEDKRLERVAKLFDVQEDDIEVDKDKLVGEFIGDNRVFIGNKYVEKMPCPQKNPKDFSILADAASRLLEVSRSDESVSARLYNITETGLDKVDEERSNLFFWSKDEEIKRPHLFSSDNLEELRSPYQGYSYLPAYFYHKHDFKMFDKKPSQEIDYENLYNPEDNPDEEYTCPVCNSNEIITKGWDFTCENCGYEDSAPYFRGHEHLYPDRVYPNKASDLSEEKPKKLIIELDEESHLCRIEETALIEALDCLDEDFRISDKTKDRISYINRAQKWPKIYKLQNSAIIVNGEKVNPSYNFKLSGSEEVYPKYKIELPSSEDKIIRSKNFVIKSLKALFIISSILIILAQLWRLSQLT